MLGSLYVDLKDGLISYMDGLISCMDKLLSYKDGLLSYMDGLLFYIYATEVAVPFEVEGIHSVGVLGVAFALDTGEGGINIVPNADALVDTNLHTTKIAVDIDDGTVNYIGIPQVKADESEAGVNVCAIEQLAIIAITLLAETNVNLA